MCIKIGRLVRKCSLLLILLIVILTGTVLSSAEGEDGVTWPILEDMEFGGVCIGCAPEEFLQAGFCLGDSCDVELSNGFRIEDVPVYDGYYERSSWPVIVLYPGYEYPHFTYCTTGNMWGISGVTTEDTIRVTLRDRGKYLAEQEMLSTAYSNERQDFESDMVFANFRPFSGGRMRNGMFWRGVSPVNNQYNRAHVADALLKENGIGFILDLADSQEDAEAYEAFPGSYAAELASDGKMVFLDLTAAFMSPEFGKGLISGFRAMMAQDQQVYIHCTEGKDRTGFVCLLLESLAGATFEELRDDYMLTFSNYYGITPESNPEKYNALLRIKLFDIICQLSGEAENMDFSGQTFENEAREYLLRNGMTTDEVNQLIRYLTAE